MFGIRHIKFLYRRVFPHCPIENILIIPLLLIYISCISCNRGGYIVTSDNDTLKGTLEGEIDLKLHNFVWFKDSKINKKVKININNIKSAIVIINKDTFTLSIFDDYFWQLLAAKDSLSIYRKVYGVPIDNHFSTMIQDIALFVNKRQKFIIYSGAYILPSEKNTVRRVVDSKIVAFINAQYNQNFSINNFKDEKSVFDYILNKEIMSENR